MPLTLSIQPPLPAITEESYTDFKTAWVNLHRNISTENDADYLLTYLFDIKKLA
jgi:hypothetical protein